MSGFSRHPFLVFAFGVIVGYHAHKYRKELTEAAAKAAIRDEESGSSSSGTFADILSGLRQGAQDAKRA